MMMARLTTELSRPRGLQSRRWNAQHWLSPGLRVARKRRSLRSESGWGSCTTMMVRSGSWLWTQYACAPTEAKSPHASAIHLIIGRKASRGVLHPVHRFVGGGEERSRIARVIRVEAHADARAATHLGALPVERRVE